MKIMRAVKNCLLAFAITLVATELASSQDVRKIKIVMSSESIAASAAKITREMGLFSKYGLDASAVALDSGANATAAVLAGSADFATAGTSELVAIQARGEKLVALTSSYSGFAAVVVLSNAAVAKVKVAATAPISDRLKALDGLVIASSSPSSTNTVGTVTSAASVGSKPKMVYMSQPAMVAALQSGALDGFVAAAPYYVQPVLSGTGTIWINGPKGEFPPQFVPPHATVVMTKRDFAVANPDLIKRVVAAFTEMGKATVERPADVKAAIARIFPTVDAKTLDLVFETELKGLALRPLSVGDMARTIDVVKSSGAQVPGIDNVVPAALLFP